MVEGAPSPRKHTPGTLWTIAKGVQIGDIVICPDGKGSYYCGEVAGGYEYHGGEILPHRRAVRWFAITLSRDEMSQSLRHSAGSIGTISQITKHADELEDLLRASGPETFVPAEEPIEDPSVFALEKHLEDFLLENWQATDLAKTYNIYEEDGDIVGKQYPTDAGPIDILAVSKDKSELLVIELKKGRASDGVVGQILRYMATSKTYSPKTVRL